MMTTLKHGDGWVTVSGTITGTGSTKEASIADAERRKKKVSKCHSTG